MSGFGRRTPALPLGMFDHVRSAEQAMAAMKLERLYHKGQDRAWNGKEVLAHAVARHGGVRAPAAGIEPLRRLFAVILWGELAAWKISAKLALHIEPLEAKMAATSQAHDEARHFYVMRDYLELLGELPRELRPRSVQLIERVLAADDVAKMLLGMQLVIEPMALTLFHLVRQRHVEPVLGELLSFIERDEARHVALGVLYLPDVLRDASPPALADLAAWQLRTYLLQLRVLKEMEPDFAALGIDAREVLRIGRKKQVMATGMVAEQLGRNLPVTEAFLRIIDFKSELDFPTGPRSRRLRDRVARGLWVAARGPGEEWAGRHARRARRDRASRPGVDTSVLVSDDDAKRA